MKSSRGAESPIRVVDLVFSSRRVKKVRADYSIQPSQRRACEEGEGGKKGDAAQLDRRQVQDDPQPDCCHPDEEETVAAALPGGVLQQRAVPRVEPQSWSCLCRQR